ncbi:MAG: thioredoxin family protein [Firmicutes bacterium]|nr:thioredoxin family protein [Bacillota bacterium]
MEKYSKNSNFDLDHGSYLVEFSAKWCGTCRKVNRTLLEVEKDVFLKVIQIDVEEHTDLAKKFNIKGIPVLLYLVNGKEISRISGSLDEEEFNMWFHKVIIKE